MQLHRTILDIGVSQEIGERWMAELSRPHRHYHTVAHIYHIVNTYNRLGMSDPNIYAAAWLHDIRYDAQRTDNEEVSAEIAKEDLKGTAIDIPLVVDIILDTKHHGGGSPTLDLFSDLDLAIFSGYGEQYDSYMLNIRKEYSFVPLDIYAEKRALVLEKFDSQQIYRTEHFRSREQLAHINLKREISILRTCPEAID